MTIFSFRTLVLAAVLCAAGPALAQTPTLTPEDGASFACDDGTKLGLTFTDADNSVSALVLLHGVTYKLPYQPPEPGPVQVVWSDGEHSLTWMTGVRLMWMASDAHLMCGRGSHKH